MNVSQTKQVVTEAKDTSYMTRARMAVAEKFLKLIFGRKMHISPFKSSTIATCAILWYFEGNTRYFVLVKDKSVDSKARFISCLDASKFDNIPEALASAIIKAAGDGFFRSIDRSLLDIDRIVTAPSFRFDDKVTGQTLPIQSLVWALQITKEQAVMCACDNGNAEIVYIPEYALLSPDVAQSHKIMYQASLKNIHGTNTPQKTVMVDKLEDLIASIGVSQKVLH